MAVSPDLANREEYEQKIADALEKEFNRFSRELGKLIPALSAAAFDIPGDVLTAHNEKLLATLAPQMRDIMLARAAEIIEALGFTSIDWALVDSAASEFARRYTYELIRGINSTTQQRLQSIIPQFFEQQWTQGQLTEQLMNANGAFGRLRAEMIARTEVTRAASESVQQTKRELQKQGIAMVPVWRTRNDELVCPICGPRNGLVIEPGNDTNGEYPPAHPRCRCGVSLELPETA